MPWAVDETRVKLTVKNPGAADGDGTRPERECPRVCEGRSQAACSSVELPRDAMYVVLKAEWSVESMLGDQTNHERR